MSRGPRSPRPVATSVQSRPPRSPNKQTNDKHLLTAVRNSGLLRPWSSRKLGIDS